MSAPIFTTSGFGDLKKEKETLAVDRKAAVIDLKKARDMGDLSENGYYKAARFKLNDIDRRIRLVTHLLKTGIVQEKVVKETVDIGCVVTVVCDGVEKSYEMVGGFESNPLKGLLSIISPLGKMLMGKKKGEKIVIQTPQGEKNYVIVDFSYAKT